MEKDKKIENAFIETYADDMAEVIKDEPGGLVRKIIQGEEEHEMEKRNLSPESKRNRFFMIAGILLIAFALGILSFFLFNKNANTVLVQKQFTPLIFTDQSTFLEVAGLKKEEITQTVSNQINATEVKTGGVEGIYLTENKQIIGLRRFIALINGSFILDSNPLLINDNFLMGTVFTEPKPVTPEAGAFFILIKVNSITDIFDSLRAWERKMFSDLHGFLGINIGSDTSYLLTKNFEDGIVENKNTRILNDQNGKLVLMYVFANDNSVIITNSQGAAHEIMSRLASSQVKQ